MEGKGGRRGKQGELIRAEGREGRGPRGGVALFTVTWLPVGTCRCSLQINPLRASQAPGPFTPATGCHPGALGRKLLPGKLLPLTLDPFSPYLGFCRQRWQHSLLHEPGSHFRQLVGARCLLSIQPAPTASLGFFTAAAPALPPTLFWAGELGVQVGCPPSPSPILALVKPIRAPGDKPEAVAPRRTGPESSEMGVGT